MNTPIASMPQSAGSATSSQPFPTAAAAAGDSADSPSTAGFLQVLDLLLSDASIAPNGAAEVANLFAPTTVTNGGEASKAANSSDAGQDSSDGSDAALDPVLCSDLASLLQMLGFQVRPEQIAELKPLDQQQLGASLEFAAKSLARGVDSRDVAENMTFILPRPWPLTGLDGTPESTEMAAGANTSDDSVLPAGFDDLLANVREKMSPKPESADRPAIAAGESKDADRLVQGTAAATDGSAAGSTAKTAVSESSASPTPAPAATPPRNRPEANGQARTGEEMAAVVGADASLAASRAATTEVETRRHSPVCATSEFIGRQVLEKVQVQLDEGRKELSLRLWPEELGEVRLALRMDDGSKVQAHIVVENDSVRQAMIDSMPQLRDALARHGMDLEKMSVSVGQQDAGSAGSGSASPDDDGEKRKGGNGRGGRGNRSGQEMDVAVPLVLGRDTGRRDGRNTFELWS